MEPPVSNKEVPSTRKKFKVPLLILTIILSTSTLIGTYLWNWGKELNYWGTPTAMQILLDEKIANPATFDYTPTTLETTKNVPIGGKSQPYNVKYLLNAKDFDATVQNLKQVALNDDWQPAATCPITHLFCAYKDVKGHSKLWLTIRTLDIQSNNSHTFPIQVNISYY